jgi:hypothetical protein
MLDIKVKGLFDVLNMTIGVNGDQLETTMQLEVASLSTEAKEKIVQILNDHIDSMMAGDLIRKLND